MGTMNTLRRIVWGKPPDPGPRLENCGFDDSWQPPHWRSVQRRYRRAAETLGLTNLKPGERRKVTVTLQTDGSAVQVWLAGHMMDFLSFDELAARVAKIVSEHGEKRGRWIIADADCHFYHFKHGRWGMYVYA